MVLNSQEINMHLKSLKFFKQQVSFGELSKWIHFSDANVF